jgi:hypothetical protein
LFELKEHSDEFLEAECKTEVAALQIEFEKKQNELQLCEAEAEFLSLKKEFANK